MRNVSVGLLVVSICLGTGAFAQVENPPKLENPLKGKYLDAETTAADQTDVAVTVYNNDLALVRDQRKITLLPGEQLLKFMDVAQQILPQTVNLKSLSAPGSLHVLEQNYEFDLMTPSKLLEKYVGKHVTLRNFDKDRVFESVEAELLSVNESPVYRVGGQIYLGHPGQVVLPDLPEDLIAKPSLIWLLQNEGTDHQVEVTYLTHGISWQADYVLTLDKTESKLALEGWVTLNNQCGTSFKDAQLKLVAGDVHVVQDEVRPLEAKAGMMVARAPEPMKEEAFAEYHLYSLPRRTTIKQNQSKQVSLLSAENISVTKLYELRGAPHFYFDRVPPLRDQKVSVFLKFRNSKENALGMPLPAGVMRVYQEDSDGMLQFVGEDRIQHTPKDEDVRIQLGTAFDVVAERVQTDFQRIADTVTETAFEIAIRNHKDKPIVVDIVEQLPAEDWTIVAKSHDFVKKDAQTAVFSVPVQENNEAKVSYRVRVTTR